MPHYVTKLWKKNYWHELRSVRVIASITMTVIFLERWEGAATEYLKRQFNTKRKVRSSYLEMKLSK
jgi:hypothetical protein